MINLSNTPFTELSNFHWAALSCGGIDKTAQVHLLSAQSSANGKLINMGQTKHRDQGLL